MRILSLGAGVQSSTLALMAEKGVFEDKPDCAIFADTQAEPASVYTWLDWLEGQLSYPVYRVTAGSLTDRSKELKLSKTGTLYSKCAVPVFTSNKGKLRRKCTRDHKITPIIQKIRSLVDLKTFRREHRDLIKQVNASDTPTLTDAFQQLQSHALVEQWMGISTDEISRAKDSAEYWIRHRWPLIEIGMSREDCKQWMLDEGYPEPPRSACVYCPFHSDKEWMRLKNEEPAEFQKAVEFERDLQNVTKDVLRETPYLHSTRQNLDTVIFSETDNPLFNEECEGMCGI